MPLDFYFYYGALMLENVKRLASREIMPLMSLMQTDNILTTVVGAGHGWYFPATILCLLMPESGVTVRLRHCSGLNFADAARR